MIIPSMRRAAGIATFVFAAASVLFADPAGGSHPLRVLVFTKTTGALHPTVPDAVAALQRLGATRGWSVTQTADAATFTDANLRSFDVAVWLNNAGAVLDPDQQAAYERFHRSGKGTVGIRDGCVATDHATWPWLRRLVPSVPTPPAAVRTITVLNYDHKHPAAATIPMMWRHTDEWHHYTPNPAPDAHILLFAWDAEFANPVAWYKDFDGGRFFYTGLGGTRDDYRTDAQFLAHLAGGIEWAGGVAPNPVVRVTDGDALILREFDGVSANGVWDKQRPSPEFAFTVGRDALAMTDSSAISQLNRHVVRRGVAIDPRRPYAIEGKFKVPGPIDRKPHSFCVNLNVAGPDGDPRNVSTWSLNVHLLGGGKSMTRLMGFVDGGFAQIGELDHTWGEPDVEYGFRIQVNADLRGLYQDKLVSMVVTQGDQVVEKFQVDYSSFPYQPDYTKPVRLGFNGHGTAWTLRDLKVYYLDVLAGVPRLTQP